MSEQAQFRIKFYEIIKTFKEQICTLLADESLVLGVDQRRIHIKKVGLMYDKLMMAKSANSKLAIQLFHDSVLKTYGSYILARDEKFFLDNKSLLDAVAKDDLGFDILVDEISSIWSQLDSHNKNIIWRYVIALCKVCDKAVGDGYFERLQQGENRLPL